MIDVEVHLYTQSQPMKYQGVLNTYTKGGMYCVYYDTEDGDRVDKFPLEHIFRAREDYR